VSHPTKDRRLDTAQRLGAPIELCIECLTDFLGPEGVEVQGRNVVPGVMGVGTRICCSMRCATKYSEGRPMTPVILTNCSDRVKLAEREFYGGSLVWIFTDAGKEALL
jgi:hypothetical protein